MIETLNDLNDQACCCTLTLCPVPTTDCDSVSSSLSAAGYMDEDDTTWKVYKKEGYTMDAVSSASTYFDASYGDLEGSLATFRSTDVHTFNGYEYTFPYEGGIGLNPECFFITPTIVPSCTATGTSQYKLYVYSGGVTGDLCGNNFDATIGLGLTIDKVVASAEGEETLAHIAWEEIVMDYGTVAAWEADFAAWEAEVAAHDAWVILTSDYETWESVRDTHDEWEAVVAAHDAWQAIKDAHDAWELDPVGPEPPVEGAEPPIPGEEPPLEGTEPPAPGAEPSVRAEPIHPYPEPDEFYGPCDFKVTTTKKVETTYWGKYGPTYSSYFPACILLGGAPLPGTSAAPTPDPVAFAEWVETNSEDEPPSPGEASRVDYMPVEDVVSFMSFAIGGDPGTPFVEVFGLTEPLSFSEWMDVASAAMDVDLNFDEAGCLQNECTALLSKSTEPVLPDPVGSFVFINDDASITKRKARVRFQIPSTWADQISGLTVAFTGTYFKITYDIIEEPTGWDDAPPTALRSYVSVDNVVTWTGPGSGAADDPSWFTSWITLDPPPTLGVRRIVNIRFVCRENWFIGEVPQVTGEAVTLPDP